MDSSLLMLRGSFQFQPRPLRYFSSMVKSVEKLKVIHFDLVSRLLPNEHALTLCLRLLQCLQTAGVHMGLLRLEEARDTAMEHLVMAPQAQDMAMEPQDMVMATEKDSDLNA